jgi:hypothetical protein
MELRRRGGAANTFWTNVFPISVGFTQHKHDFGGALSFTSF